MTPGSSPGASPRPRLGDRVRIATWSGDAVFGTVVGVSANPGLPAHLDVRPDGMTDLLKLRDHDVKVLPRHAPPDRPAGNGKPALRLAAADGELVP